MTPMIGNPMTELLIILTKDGSKNRDKMLAKGKIKHNRKKNDATTVITQV